MLSSIRLDIALLIKYQQSHVSHLRGWSIKVLLVYKEIHCFRSKDSAARWLSSFFSHDHVHRPPCIDLSWAARQFLYWFWSFSASRRLSSNVMSPPRLWWLLDQKIIESTEKSEKSRAGWTWDLLFMCKLYNTNTLFLIFPQTACECEWREREREKDAHTPLELIRHFPFD